MNRFVTLMKREWLQHRVGWLVLLVLPSALMLGLSLLDGHGVHVVVNAEDANLPPMALLPLPVQTLGWVAATTVLAFVFALLTVMGQFMGLARRDIQDRSIEFWRSLPVNDVQAVAAPLLMHTIVMPTVVLLAGCLGALVVGAVAISLQHGVGAWLTQPWWLLLPAVLLLVVRMVLGLLLALAWLSPLLMLAMVASAWLKRWAMPVLAAGSVVAVQLFDRYLPMPVFGPTFKRLGAEALEAFASSQTLQGLHFEGPADLMAALPGLPAGLVNDGLHALGNVATPAFPLALAAGALGFWLLVWRRRRA